MFLTIENVLNDEPLDAIRSDLRSVRWEDGTKTAGQTAARVKSNQQADLTNRTGVRIRDQLTQRIQTHPVLKAAAQPARFSKILISRTQAGGHYGLHVDNPFMGIGEARLRTDLSYTLFLSDPSDYDGGELSIEMSGETKTIKAQAGTLVLYPSRFLHAVKPVTGGSRLVCVGWIESHVRHDSEREVLFDLENLRSSLSQTYDPQSPEMMVLSRNIANLLRLWSS
ncbi:MAG: Fe2+-dependent dioxygenase [Pseudomonadota bacterium]